MSADLPEASTASAPPVTGHEEVDAAMAGLVLDPASVNGHHDELTRAHETLHRTLNADPGAEPASAPGG